MTTGISDVPTTRNLSELLILDIVSRLGQPVRSELAEALRRATQDARTPFFLGNSLRDVLMSQVHHGRLRDLRRDEESSYELTNEGKELVRQFSPIISEAFPSIQQIGR